MKQLLRRILPAGLIRFAAGSFESLTYPFRPRLPTYRGDSTTVLKGCVAYNRFGGYCIPLSSRHRPAARKVLSGGVWEPDTIAYLTSNCADGDVVHGGTFFGDFLPALSQACAPGAKVWAFEPNPENYRCALITAQINGLDNVVLANSGLGSSRGSLPLLISDAGGRSLGGSSRIIQPREASPDAKRSTPVEIVTLDEAVSSDRKVSIIHFDVEGYETEALAGALKTIQRCTPILVLETLPEESWVSNTLLPLGYRVVGQVHNNTILQAK